MAAKEPYVYKVRDEFMAKVAEINQYMEDGLYNEDEALAMMVTVGAELYNANYGEGK